MESIFSDEEKLSFVVGACGIVFDVTNKILKPRKKLPRLDASKDYRSSMALYVALLFSGLDKDRDVVPEYISFERDMQSLKAIVGGARFLSDSQKMEFYNQVQRQNKIDLRNCFCHGLFDFVIAVDQFGVRREAFALYPNRSRNAGEKPIFVMDEAVRKFVEDQNKKKLSAIYNADANERQNVVISKMALEIADWYDHGKAIGKGFSKDFEENLERYGMQLFSAIVGSMLYIYNQNTLYLDLQEDEQAKDVFFTLRNSLCHGNFNKNELSMLFADPRQTSKQVEANFAEILMSVPYFLSLSSEMQNYDMTVENFVEYLNKKKEEKSEGEKKTSQEDARELEK